MRFANGLVCLLLSGLVQAPLMAQRVHQGSRVRVTAPSLTARPVVGWVDAAGPTTMTLVIRGDSVVFIPLEAVDRLELSVQRWSRSARVKHASNVGVVLGLVAGALVGFAATEPCAQGMCFRGIAILGSAAVGGLIAGSVGALIGASQPTDRWQVTDFNGAGLVHSTRAGPERRR